MRSTGKGSCGSNAERILGNSTTVSIGRYAWGELGAEEIVFLRVETK
jgi:hypothetical protein